MKQVVAMGCSDSWERKVYFRTDWLLTYVHSSVVSKRKKKPKHGDDRAPWWGR